MTRAILSQDFVRVFRVPAAARAPAVAAILDDAPPILDKLLLPLHLCARVGKFPDLVATQGVLRSFSRFKVQRLQRI